LKAGASTQPRPESRSSRENVYFMLLIAFALLLIMAVAGLVTAYVAFPHRGQAIPHAAWLSDAMVKASDKLRP
jgi:hypothetical protein